MPPGARVTPKRIQRAVIQSNPFGVVARFLQNNEVKKPPPQGLSKAQLGKFYYLAAQHAMDTFLEKAPVSGWVRKAVAELRDTKLAAKKAREAAWTHTLHLRLMGFGHLRSDSQPLVEHVFKSKYHRLQLNSQRRMVIGRNVAEVEALQNTLKQVPRIVKYATKGTGAWDQDTDEPDRDTMERIQKTIRDTFDSFPRAEDVLNTTNRRSVPADVQAMYERGIRRLETQYETIRDRYVEEMLRMLRQVNAMVNAKVAGGKAANASVYDVMSKLADRLHEFATKPLRSGLAHYKTHLKHMTHQLRQLTKSKSVHLEIGSDLEKLDEELKLTKAAHDKWTRMLQDLTSAGMHNKLPLLKNNGVVDAKQKLLNYINNIQSRPLVA